jgi:hypothetical protein
MQMLFFPFENPSFNIAHILQLRDLSLMHAVNSMPRIRQLQSEERLIMQNYNFAFSFV